MTAIDQLWSHASPFDRVLTVGEVADIVKLSTKTVMRAIAAGELAASQLTRGRGGWRIYESAIADWMERRSNRRRPPTIGSGQPIDAKAARPPTPARRSSEDASAGALVLTADMGRRDAA